ncbi:MAG: cellobiose transport system permease protein [Actinomycetota bacterium]|nr:cellobiose transport system permease protein [Actinomycetota bacterium]
MTALSEQARLRASPARRGRTRRGTLGSRAAYAYVAPFFLVFGAFGLYPLLYTAWVSLHNVNLENLHHSSWVGFHNYVALWHNEFFWNALRNTLTIGVISTVPQLCMALGLAHLLNYKMRGRTFFRVAMLMPYATSVVAATLIFAELFGRDYGLVNWVLHLVGVHHTDWTNGTRWQSQVAISAIVTWRWTGYNALIYLAGMQSIGTELYEAAAIDGSSRWQQFRYVTIPSLRPTILFTIVLSTIGAMQMFAEPYLFAGDGTTNGGGEHQYQTLALFLYQQGWTNFHLGQAAATAWTMLAIILVLVCINSALARGRTRRGAVRG